jgi:hypothetical protein
MDANLAPYHLVWVRRLLGLAFVARLETVEIQVPGAHWYSSATADVIVPNAMVHNAFAYCVIHEPAGVTLEYTEFDPTELIPVVCVDVRDPFAVDDYCVTRGILELVLSHVLSFRSVPV